VTEMIGRRDHIETGIRCKPGVGNNVLWRPSK
jgi:hypothetical protein